MYSDDFKPENYRYVGKNAAPRKDAKAIVSGKAVFLDDFTLPGMLIGYTCRLPAQTATCAIFGGHSVT